jgi:hypothetical protein
MNVISDNLYWRRRGGINVTNMMDLEYSTGNLNILGAYGYLSDIRLKEDITDTDYNLTDLMKIKVRNFKRKDIGGKHTGFIAQELYEACPEAVNKPDSAEDMWGINQTNLFSLVVKSIQDLKNDFEKRLSKLEKAIL